MEGDLDVGCLDIFDELLEDLAADAGSGERTVAEQVDVAQLPAATSGFSLRSNLLSKIKPVKSCKTTKKPRSSSQHHELKLVLFPSFEKCDTLIYFPHALARHLNSGDAHEISRLMHSHSSRDCLVRFSENEADGCSYKNLLNILTFSMDLHPDAVMCVHSTSVAGHQISATMYFKYTDCRYINSALRSLAKERNLVRMVESRGDRMKQNLRLDSRPEPERAYLSRLIDSGEDIVVYGKIHLVLTLESRSKKISSILLDSQFTSVAPTLSAGNDQGDHALHW
jgi:hypothetical protein